MPEAQTVEQVFEEIPSRFRRENAVGMQATYQFDITGDDGGTWHVRIDDGELDVRTGPAGQADVIISARAGDWISMVNGSLNPQLAFMTGRLKVQGDLGLAMRLQHLVF